MKKIKNSNVRKNTRIKKEDIPMILELLSEGITLTFISYFVYGKSYYYLRDNLIYHQAWPVTVKQKTTKRKNHRKILKQRRLEFIKSLSW